MVNDPDQAARRCFAQRGSRRKRTGGRAIKIKAKEEGSKAKTLQEISRKAGVRLIRRREKLFYVQEKRHL